MVKILILGGGFGGIRTALDLEKKLRDETEITLIDKNSYHLFVPDLYEVASVYGMERDPFAVKMKKTICIPFADIFENKKINFVQAEVAEIDLKNQKVITKGENELDYDYLVLGFGSQPTDFGIPGVMEYTYQFKSLTDGLMVNETINDLLEKASQGKKNLPVRILIIGAGFTGIELGAELSCCIKNIANRCRMDRGCTIITLFEASPKILPMVSEKERQMIEKRLTNLGVVLMANSPIEEVGSGFVKLRDGHTMSGDMIIWTAGIQPNKILQNIKGLTLNKGKVIVNSNLIATGHENIFAIGDNVEFIDPATHKPIPAMAYIAGNQGKVAANNIYNLIKNKKLQPYKPAYDTWIAPTGGKFAVAHLWGMTIKGFWGWIIRELVDLRHLLSILSFKKALKVFWEETTIFMKND